VSGERGLWLHKCPVCGEVSDDPAEAIAHLEGHLEERRGEGGKRFVKRKLVVRTDDGEFAFDKKELDWDDVVGEEWVAIRTPAKTYFFPKERVRLMIVEWEEVEGE
jgi:hypothetical protein